MAQAIAEIIQLLQQGIDPKVLIEKGVPQELVQAAMEQMQMQDRQPQGSGLAAGGM